MGSTVVINAWNVYLTVLLCSPHFHRPKWMKSRLGLVRLSCHIKSVNRRSWNDYVKVTVEIGIGPVIYFNCFFSSFCSTFAINLLRLSLRDGFYQCFSAFFSTQTRSNHFSDGSICVALVFDNSSKWFSKAAHRSRNTDCCKLYRCWRPFQTVPHSNPIRRNEPWNINKPQACELSACLQPMEVLVNPAPATENRFDDGQTLRQQQSIAEWL